MRLVKFTLFLTVVTILVCLSMLIGIALTYTGDTNLSDDQIGAGEEITPPAIDIELSMAVIPDADGKVPEGGVSASDDKATVEIPAGVQLEEGAESLTFTATSMEETHSNVAATHRSEVVHSMDVHVNGVSKANTVPMTIKLNGILPTGLNSNNVKLFHVENGETVEMTLVATPVNHNEFSYDPLTGDAVIAIASFSEITAYADTNNPWDGKTFDYDWYDANATELTIANAEEFAAFRNIVDGGYYDQSTDPWTWVEVEQDSFKNKTVKLSAHINLGGHNFDPIGWGYDNSAWNRGGRDGLVFQGTFDGDYHTIYGLYQNGWDLDPDKANYSNYTYTNCGGGLFACALDATFENLTINGADIRFECVEIGVLVGLAQGGCNFNNINILGSKIANYQRPAGGVVGEVSPKIDNGAAVASTHTFNNVYVDSNTVVGSMWGDFDAPVGGVIGAYWDDAGMTSVNMIDVTVACRLDVYNDVTSTYQWYAYRRAGMLIGNTDRADGHTATAPYLTCTDVTVYYGEWANYHYCEFNEANPKWPWVRVEPGENCSGYSNPRWGRPIDPNTGNPVTDSAHDHGENEGHLESIPFHQLYGGGQGVYGEEIHSGVSEDIIYTVTYMDRGEILHVDYITDNTVAYDADDLWPIKNATAANGEVPSYWADANGNKFEGFGAGHTADATVYPKWPNEYTIRCLDTKGNVVYYNFITDDYMGDADYQQIANDINAVLLEIQNEVDKDKKVMVMVWDILDDGKNTTYASISGSDIKNFITSNKIDFVIEATPQLVNTSITLEKYYDPVTGELVAYHVIDVNASDDNKNVVIPDYVGNIPVTNISDGAFNEFDNLYSVRIPDTVTYIGENAFPGGGIFNGGRETITIYTDIDPDTFKAWFDERDDGTYTHLAKNWDQYLGDGSRIFFLDENGKVDPEAGYWECYRSGLSKYYWGYHDHEYSHGKHTGCNIKVSGEQDSYYADGRPDKEYWQ